MAKVVGRIIGSNAIEESGVIKGVVIVAPDGTKKIAMIGDMLHEGDKIVSDNPHLLLTAKYLAQPEDSDYSGVFTVLADGAVTTPADASDNVVNTSDVDNIETAAGDDNKIPDSSSAYIPMEAQTDPVPLVAIDNGNKINTNSDEVSHSSAQIQAYTTPESTDSTAPKFISDSTVIYDENSNDTVIQVKTTDTSDVSYSLGNSIDSALFSINSTTGELTFRNSPDYENPQDNGKDNIYNVDVVARDAYGNESTQELSVYINNVNDNIPTAENIAFDVVEDGSAVSGQLVASDADHNQIEYVVTSDLPAEDGQLTVDPQTGAFTYEIGDNFQYLAEGETTTVTFTYKAVETDSPEAYASTPDSTITITITGTNDQPIVQNVVENVLETDFTGSVEVDGITINNLTYASSVADHVSDVDSSDTHTFAMATYDSQYGLTDDVALGIKFTETNAGLLSLYQAAEASPDAFNAFKAEAIEMFHSSSRIGAIVASSDTLSTLLSDMNDAQNMDDLESVINGTPGLAMEANYSDDNVLQSLDIFAEATQDQYNKLVEHHLVDINMNEDGSYNITTPFVDALAGDENVDITFAYNATDSSAAQNDTSANATVTVSVDGVNDEPVVGTVDTDNAVIGMFDIDGGNVDLSNVVAMSDFDKINGVVVAGRTELNVSVQDVLDIAANDNNAIAISSSDHVADAVHLGENFDLDNAIANDDGTHTYVGTIDVNGATETACVTIDDTIVVD